MCPKRPKLSFLATAPSPNAEGFRGLGRVAEKDCLSLSARSELELESLFEPALLRKLAGLEFRSPLSDVFLLSYEGCFINGAAGGRRGICISISFDMKLLWSMKELGTGAKGGMACDRLQEMLGLLDANGGYVMITGWGTA